MKKPSGMVSGGLFLPDAVRLRTAQVFRGPALRRKDRVLSKKFDEGA